MKILIKVTKEVLTASMMCGRIGGEPNQNCAIAVAVRDIAPRAEVYITHINWLGNNVPIYQGWDERSDFSRVPKHVQEFIKLFDSTEPVGRPHLPEFSFEVDLPNEVIDRITIPEAYRILSESKTLELVHP